MNTLFACLPCYNEEENIIPLTLGWLEQEEALKKEGFSLQVVAIDDKSTDSTKAVSYTHLKLHPGPERACSLPGHPLHGQRWRYRPGQCRLFCKGKRGTYIGPLFCG